MCVISLYGIQLYSAARFRMAVLFSDVHTKFFVFEVGVCNKILCY